MSDKTGIEWTDATWNPTVGCSIVSPGCTNCYAMRQAHRQSTVPGAKFHGLTEMSKGGPVWNGGVRLDEGALDQPLRWRRPRRIFVNSMSDLFHESLPDEAIDKVFAVMALAPQHTFQVLTKRARRMRDYLKGVSDDGALGVNRFGVTALWTGLCGPGGPIPSWPLPNVWLGVSVERQQEADERIPLLLDTPAAVRFLSCEPLLGPIDLTGYLDSASLHCKCGQVRACVPADAISYMASEDGFAVPLCSACGNPCKAGRRPPFWVIVGGESGPGARPMHPDWARSLRDQCETAGVPFFFKQWGEWAPEEDLPGIDVMSLRYGEFHGGKDWVDSCMCNEGDDGACLYRIGKKRAGRLLDGREWNEFPQHGGD